MANVIICGNDDTKRVTSEENQRENFVLVLKGVWMNVIILPLKVQTA